MEQQQQQQQQQQQAGQGRTSSSPSCPASLREGRPRFLPPSAASGRSPLVTTTSCPLTICT
jgi:hypothetical protein